MFLQRDDAERHDGSAGEYAECGEHRARPLQMHQRQSQLRDQPEQQHRDPFQIVGVIGRETEPIIAGGVGADGCRQQCGMHGRTGIARDGRVADLAEQAVIGGIRARRFFAGQHGWPFVVHFRRHIGLQRHADVGHVRRRGDAQRMDVAQFASLDLHRADRLAVTVADVTGQEAGQKAEQDRHR
jgi:hypothetical protein